MLIDALRYWTIHQPAAPRIAKPAPARRRFRRPSDSHLRSVMKAVCWRILGSIDTFIITLLITGSYASAGSIASIETLSKILLYYLHERAWSNVAFGCKTAATPVPHDPVPAAADQAANDPLTARRLWIARPFVGEAAANRFTSPHSRPAPLVPASREASTKRTFPEGVN